MFGDGRVGVVFGHQIDTDQSDWWDLAAALAEEGYATLTLDFRGYCARAPVAPRTAARPTRGGTCLPVPTSCGAAAQDRIVLVGASMGGTAAVLAAARADPPVDGVIGLSAPTDCCGMTIEGADVGSIAAPMLLIAGRDDGDAPASARQLARWAGESGQLVILDSGEHGIDLIGGLAAPDVERRDEPLIRTFPRTRRRR